MAPIVEIANTGMGMFHSSDFLSADTSAQSQSWSEIEILSNSWHVQWQLPKNKIRSPPKTIATKGKQVVLS